MSGPPRTPNTSGAPHSDDLIAPGTLIEDRYEIRRPLGRGGQGDVYLAYDRNFALEVAIKFLHRDFRTDEILERFRMDAQVTVRLDHPNVVRVLDFNPRYPYIVMQYCGDGDLDAYIKSRKRRPIREILDIVRQMCDALAAAHEHNPPILHRDIKPGNVMFTGTVPKVTDFGLAKMLGGAAGMTTTRGMMGTVRYCAPEQLKDASRVDHRADLWSVGVVLYELLTWRRPFDKSGDEFVGIAIRIHSEPPRQTPYDLPPPVQDILRRALEKSPDQRFQRAREMSQALQDAILRLSAEGETLIPPQEMVDQVSHMAAEVARLMKEGRTDEASAIIKEMGRTAPEESVTRFWRKRLKASTQQGSGSAAHPSQERWLTDQAAAVQSMISKADFRGAQALLYEMLSKDPDNSAVQGLLGRVKDQEREFRDTLDRAHREADSARRGGNLDQVLRIWTEFLETCPGLPEARAEKDVAARELALQDQRRVREETLRAVAKARAGGDLDGAMALMEEFGRRYPDDAELHASLATMREEKSRAERDRALAVLRSEIDRLRREGDLHGALSRCESHLLTYPGEKDVQTLRETIRSSIEAREREDLRLTVEQWLSGAERQISAGRYGSIPKNGAALAGVLKTLRASAGGDRKALEKAWSAGRAAWEETERSLAAESTAARERLLRRFIESRGWIGPGSGAGSEPSPPGDARVAETIAGALNALARAGAAGSENDPVAPLVAADQALASATRDLAREREKLLGEKRAEASRALEEAGTAMAAGLGAAEGDEDLSGRLRACEQRLADLRSKVEAGAPDELGGIAAKARVARAEAATLALAASIRATQDLEEAVLAAAPLLVAREDAKLAESVHGAGKMLSSGGAPVRDLRQLAAAIREQARGAAGDLETRMTQARSRWRKACDTWSRHGAADAESPVGNEGRSALGKGEAALNEADPAGLERWSAILEGLTTRYGIESAWIEQRDAVFMAEGRAGDGSIGAGRDEGSGDARGLDAFRRAIAGGTAEEIRSAGRELQKAAEDRGESAASEEAPAVPKLAPAMMRLNRRLIPDRLDEFSGLAERYDQCLRSGRRGEALKIFADLDAAHGRLLRPEPLWKHPALAAGAAAVAIAALAVLLAGGGRYSVTLISLGGETTVSELQLNGASVSLPGKDSIRETGLRWDALKAGHYEVRLRGGARREFDLPGDEVVLVPGNVEFDSKILMGELGLPSPAGSGN